MKNILYFLIIISSFISCLNDNEYTSDDNLTLNLDYATPDEFQNLFTNALHNRVQNFEFTANSGYVSIESEKGVNVRFFSNCLVDANNNPITGTVQVEYIEIFNKGDMLVTNKPTMGLMSDSISKSVLRSGGEFYIKLSQNGHEVYSNCGYSLQIPTNLTQNPTIDMSTWYGVVDEDQNLTWVEDDNEQNVIIEAGFYFAFLDQFGWCNVDIFYHNSDPKTPIFVDVPNGYDFQNSSVYLSYDNDIANGLAQLDVYDDDLNLFSEHYGQIPIGLNLHVIFISESEGNYIYAIQAQTIEENEIITISNSDLQVATEDELVAIINALP